MSEAEAKQLSRCYNRGCGKEFDPREDHDEACVHHPGEPYFHDAYKGWSCCKKRSVDFTEFLNMKGCTKSRHNPVKPPEPEKREKGTDEVVVHEVRPLTRAPVDMGDINDPMTPLTSTIAPSLKQLLAASGESKDDETSAEKAAAGGTFVAVGTSCKNPGCKATFTGSSADDAVCMYHRGQAIFHEGMKYWSCCNRKTSDFTNFLNQLGCTSGEHRWIEKKKTGSRAKCRRDWHQTGSNVFIAYYAKGVDPKQSAFVANVCKLQVQMTLGNEVFEETLVLRGPIDPKESSVTLGANKVEVKMKKAAALSWKDLGDVLVERENDETAADEFVAEAEPEEPDVDLSDL